MAAALQNMCRNIRQRPECRDFLVGNTIDRRTRLHPAVCSEQEAGSQKAHVRYL